MAAPQTIRDTVFYGDSAAGTLAELAVDDSQRLTDLSVGAGGLTEANSSRMLQNTERTIDVRFRSDNTNAGVFWSYGGQRLTLTAGGTVNLIVDAATALAFDATSLFSASAHEYLLTWAMRPATAESGSGATAQWSDVYIWDLTAGTLLRGSVQHAAPTATLTTAAVWAQTGAGLNAFTGTRLAFRFSLAHHSATETYEELVSQSAPPTLAGEERVDIPVPPRSTGLGDDGQYAGPIALLAAAATHRNDLRLAGPLVSKIYRNRPTHNGALTGDEPFVIEDPDDISWGGTYLYMAYRHYRPIPPSVNRVKCRAFIQQWRTTGSADDLVIVAYSLNRPSFFYRPPTSPLAMEVWRRSYTRNADDGSGATGGTWVTFDNLRIARDLDGWSYFALGFRVDDAGGSGTIADQLWQVKAFVVDPIYEDANDNGLGLGGLG